MLQHDNYATTTENGNLVAITDDTSRINTTEALKVLNKLLNLISIHNKETLISIKYEKR